MRNPLIIGPVVGLAILAGSALHASFTWGPTDPAYNLVMQYRGDVFVLDREMTKDDCDDALPYGDRLKQVHFSCVVED